MKFETKFNKIKDMPDTELKLLSLYSLGFSCVPGGGSQKDVQIEIDRLLSSGIYVKGTK